MPPSPPSPPSPRPPFPRPVHAARRALILATGLAFAASSACASAQETAAHAPTLSKELSGGGGGGGPNFVFILIDDMGWRDLPCMGSSYYETPNIDGLAEQGVRFTNAYANAPNCAPSRACLLTGQYGPRHGIYTVNTAHRGKAKNRKLICPTNITTLDSDKVTMGEMFKAHGYATASMGKWHMGDDPTHGPNAQGFDLNIGGTHAGHPKTYFSPYRNKTIEDGPKGEYLTDRLTDEAIAFITEPRDAPFLLYLTHYAVHTPIQAKADITARYADKAPDGGQKNAKYAAMIESVDEGVGKILAALTEHDLDDDTIIIFTSDNGGHGGVTSNAPLRGCKGMLYEGGVRVPMIMTWPGHIPAGVTSNTPAIGVDILPTMLSLADLDPPSTITLDGVDLSPLLLGATDQLPGALAERSLYWHFPAYLEAGRAAPGLWRTTPASSIRMGDWKLIEFFEDNRFELYNLANDLGETMNLIEEHPQRAASMHEQLKAWREDTHAAIPHELNPKYKPPAKIDQTPADGDEAPVERTK